MPRARLVRRLLEGRDVPLVLLVAPAGYGKTSVLSEWAEHDPRPFAWLRVRDGHNDPAVLRDAVAGALEHVTDPAVLVLDDVQALRSAKALQVLRAMTDSLAPGSQLALASRREPALAVGRLRAHRSVLEMPAADLAMGRTEAAALLEAAGLRLCPADVDTLLARTEGWPAGLYLAALSLRAQPHLRRAVAGFGGDDCLVADYVRDELLAPLSRERAAFLVRASVLETVTGSLCDAVLQSTGSGRVLSELARSNGLLVALDRTEESYRFHRLFGEALRGELRRTEPELEGELHRTASAWHASRGEPEAAIRHAIAGGDTASAAELLWGHAPDQIARGSLEAVRRWLEEFAPEQIAESAPLALVAAAGRWAAGDGAQAERWTAAARSLDPAAESQRAALDVLTATAATHGVARMGADAAGAVRGEPDGGHWRSLANLLQAVSHHLTGRRDAARALLEEGGRGGAATAPNIQALCLAQLTLLVLEDEELEEAAALIGRARSQVNACGLEQYPTMALVFAVSGLVRAQRGMVQEAGGDLDRAARLLARLSDFAPWYVAETRLAMARAALRLGDVAAARGLMAETAHLLGALPDSPALAAWLEESHAQLEAVARSAGETCALTTAELRVLRLLPTHLSFPAIAARLFVSPNTVKTHARAVYRKLDASSRAEAVSRASAAGLLDGARAA